MSFFTSILLLERYFRRSCRQRRACTSHASNVAKTRPARIVHLLQIAIARGRSRRAARRPVRAMTLAGRAIPSEESVRNTTAGQSYRIRRVQPAGMRNERLQIRDKMPTFQAGAGARHFGVGFHDPDAAAISAVGLRRDRRAYR
ncbi:hypothetical protein [Burkholderia cenocepacia]|uniref:hypothetical protein n=1 Tax=Burkholderia cenocepacia TaxID=95486 RepID=UPI0015C555BD|nr:hypothetical protein [Burkholderia cenocepacia]MBR8246192.1 hypothetical protein [Burkholderia cenocepacia]MBR8288152.1 hypothetical protein [Burkholderia cenocepacia]MBR8406255.1 hypothetical protein [Burkholderia cenocepacia]MBR8498052.1 hypothetical protein [Burkholderia cenocepacia]MDR8035327.1 hypothetical protein [Burkholderia cenocepacia]